MNLLLGALAEGFILAPLALGLYLSYRVYDTLDLTTDGAFGLGAAAVAALLIRGVSPLAATLLGAFAGAIAGGVTGVVHTRLRVNASLAGVLVTTSLYSVTLFIMGAGSLSLASADSLAALSARVGRRLIGLPDSLTLMGTSVSGESLSTLVLLALVAGGLTRGLTVFLRTDLGLAMRAAGSSPQMAVSVAVDVDRMVVLGLALSNGLVALSGALLAQYQGYANIQMGIGAVVTGLAILLLGEALLGRAPLGRRIAGALAGAVVFRLLVAGAIRAGLDASALKLVTAVLLLLVLLLPRLLSLPRRARMAMEGGRHA